MWTMHVLLRTGQRQRRVHRFRLKDEFPFGETVCGITIPRELVTPLTHGPTLGRKNLGRVLCPGCFDYKKYYPRLAARHPRRYLYKQGR